jgi:hypothetical protein
LKLKFGGVGVESKIVDKTMSDLVCSDSFRAEDNRDPTWQNLGGGVCEANAKVIEAVCGKGTKPAISTTPEPKATLVEALAEQSDADCMNRISADISSSSKEGVVIKKDSSADCGETAVFDAPEVPLITPEIANTGPRGAAVSCVPAVAVVGLGDELSGVALECTPSNNATTLRGGKCDAPTGTCVCDSGDWPQMDAELGCIPDGRSDAAAGLNVARTNSAILEVFAESRQQSALRARGEPEGVLASWGLSPEMRGGNMHFSSMDGDADGY